MIGPITRARCLILMSAAAASLGCLPAVGATADSFQPAGHLVWARNGSQATVLTDGKVLITGGYQFTGTNGEAIEVAELFDPATGQSTALPTMSDQRDDSERAVLLKDGRVLIVSGGGTRVVEIFDPATRQFILGGLMLLSLGGPTASLLPDGRVLIAGGYWGGPTDPGPPVTTAAEIFDPISGKAQPTGSMRTARYRHAAVTLPDGRIVVLGGWGVDGQATSSVEIFDPSTGTFTPKGHLAQGRANMTANLVPDGRILVAGGLYADENGQPTGARQSVEIYDPATGLSTITDSLPDARWWHTAAPLPDGRILIVGGIDFDPDGPVPMDTAFLANPSTGKLTPTARMTTPRVQAAAVALPDGRVLIIGGRGQDPSSLNTVEAYAPASAPAQTPP